MTDYSEDALPLDPDFATVLLNLKLISGQSELLFLSPVTGRCFHASPIQQDYIRRAGWCLVKCSVCQAVPGVACVGESKQSIPVHADRREAAVKAKLDSVGWHTPTVVQAVPTPEPQENGGAVGRPKLQRHRQSK
jgi:integrase